MEEKSAQPDFWQNPLEAEKLMKRLGGLNENLNEWELLEKNINDLLEITRLDNEDASVSLRPEIESKIVDLEKELVEIELLTFLGGKYDKSDAILSIHAGAGGVDAQDWAEMLLRMYLRFAEKREWQVKIIETNSGAEAGIKSATLEIAGHYAYGNLKDEAGVHRLVRISPFDAEQMRHTSFALVEVIPEIEDVKIEIKPDDLKIDTYLSSGAGGQNVQKVETAIRITHLPTKISVSCQSERSQHQNRERAMKILRAKLYQYYEAKVEAERERLRGEYKSASWGNQIRSYVLQPYKMVKDHRTNYETSDVQKVLDGYLDEFIESYLRLKQDEIKN